MSLKQTLPAGPKHKHPLTLRHDEIKDELLSLLEDVNTH